MTYDWKSVIHSTQTKTHVKNSNVSTINQCTIPSSVQSHPGLFFLFFIFYIFFILLYNSIKLLLIKHPQELQHCS